MGGGSDSKKQLGKILLQQKLVSPDELQGLLEEQKREPGSRLASTAARKGRLTMLDALRVLSEQHGVPPVDLTEQVVPLAILRLLPAEIARERIVLPFRIEGDQLLLAMASPQERELIDELEFVTGKKIQAFVALDHVIRLAIDYAYGALATGAEYYVGANVGDAQLSALGLPSLPRAPEPLSEPPAAPPPGEPEAEPAVAVSVPRVLSEELDQAFGARLRPSGAPVVAAPSADARLLLALRDGELRAQIAKAVRETGVSVVETGDGQRVLELIRGEPPRVLVLDVVLPSAHGLDICRRLRASPRYAELPLVILSDAFGGWRMARDLQVNYGVEHFFEPPFDLPKLVRTMALLLDGQPVSNAPPPLSTDVEGLWNAGMAAFERGDLDAAIGQLEAGLRADPQAFELHYHLGLLYGRRDELFAAIRELETAIALQTAHFAAIKNLAVVYQKAGFRHKALDAWERAMTAAPDDETRANIKEHMVSLL